MRNRKSRVARPVTRGIATDRQGKAYSIHAQAVRDLLRPATTEQKRTPRPLGTHVSRRDPGGYEGVTFSFPTDFRYMSVKVTVKVAAG